jgi:hypothetical protein
MSLKVKIMIGLMISMITLLGVWHSKSRELNYSRLEALLKSKKWVEADRETSDLVGKVLVNIVDDNNFWGYSRIDYVLGFGQERITILRGQSSCQDIKRFNQIDLLWAKHSDDKYGFTSQSNALKNTSEKSFDEYFGWDMSSSGYEWSSGSIIQFSDWIQKNGSLPSPYWITRNSTKSLHSFYFLRKFHQCKEKQ